MAGSPVSVITSSAADDEAQLYDACKNGDKNIVKQLLKKGIDPNTLDQEGKPPIYYAASKGHVEIVRLFLAECKPACKLDCLKEPAYVRLHNACGNDDYKEVKHLLGLPDAAPNALNHRLSTPLHYAAGNGFVRIVELLLEHNVKLNIVNKSKNTPLMDAVINGHTKVVNALLKAHSVSVSYNVEEDVTQNVLDEAIQREHEDVAMAIVESRHVFKALSYNNKDPISGKVTTPLKKLFNVMPAVAEEAFKAFMDVPKHQTISRNSEKFKVTFHYEYIDDQLIKPTSSNCCGFRENIDGTNHSLYVLAHSKSKELLRNPLITTLLLHKFFRLGLWIFLMSLFVNLTFVAFLTAFASITFPVQSENCTESSNSDGGNSACQREDGTDSQVVILSVIVIIFSMIRLFFEGFQIALLRFNYFLDWINYLELFLFSGSILFAFIFTTDCLCPTSWQWEIGAVCVFLGWIDLILSVRMVPVIGIYVVMFLVIVKNFLKVITLAVFLIFSFAFSFSMLFSMYSPFQNSGTSFIKTLTMTTGEFEYDTIFHTDSILQFPGASFVLWVLFIILMPILLNNLLVALAVEDVKVIQENAKISSLVLLVEFILMSEKFTPKCLISSDYIIAEKTVKPSIDNIYKSIWYQAIDSCHFKSTSHDDYFKQKWNKFLKFCHFDTQAANVDTKGFLYRIMEFSYFDEDDAPNASATQDNEQLQEKVEALGCKLEKIVTSREALDHKLDEDNKHLQREVEALDRKLEFMVTSREALDHKLELMVTSREALDRKLDEVMKIMSNIATQPLNNNATQQ